MELHIRTRLLTLILLCSFTLTQTSNEKRPFTVTDLHQLRRIRGSTASAVIGKSRYFVLDLDSWTPNSEEKSSPTSKLYYFEVKLGVKDDSNIKEIELNISGSSPKFATGEGSTLLYYLKSAVVDKTKPDEAYSNLFYIDFNDVLNKKPIKETQVTNYPIDIESFKLSSSGKEIAFHMQVYPSCKDLKCSYDAYQSFLKRGKNTYMVYDQAFTNHWDVWMDDRVNNVFYLNTNSQETEPINLLNNASFNIKANSPVPPFGGDDLYDISPNGKYVAFTVAPRKDEAINTNWKIYIASFTDGEVKILNDLVDKNIGRQQNPQFKDDETLFYTAMPRNYLESDYTYLSEYNLNTKVLTELTKSFDYSIASVVISNLDKKLFFTVDYDGQTELFLFNSPEEVQSIKPLKDSTNENTSKAVPYYFDIIEGVVVAYGIVNGDLSPNKFVRFVFDASFNYTYEVIYDPNPSFYSTFMLPRKNEKIHFDGATRKGDKKSQGWVIYPINYEEHKDVPNSFPIAFLIHGGPESSFGNHWSTRWNPLLWSSQGYFVVMINPEGSFGQGQDYVDAVRNHWGSYPFETLKAGYKYFVNTYKEADPTRACAAGASFGGYMVNWIQGKQGEEHDPDFHFQCLVTHDGVYSILSMFYITEELWFPRAEYCEYEDIGECSPYNDKYRDNFLKYSPHTKVAYWNVPHLIIHGSNDLRIPVSEGLAAFTSLQLRGVDSKFLHFTEENHWVLRRENSVAWYENVLGWFDKYTNKSK